MDEPGQKEISEAKMEEITSRADRALGPSTS